MVLPSRAERLPSTLSLFFEYTHTPHHHHHPRCPVRLQITARVSAGRASRGGITLFQLRSLSDPTATRPRETCRTLSFPSHFPFRSSSFAFFLVLRDCRLSSPQLPFYKLLLRLITARALSFSLSLSTVVASHFPLLSAWPLFINSATCSLHHPAPPQPPPFPLPPLALVGRSVDTKGKRM